MADHEHSEIERLERRVQQLEAKLAAVPADEPISRRGYDPYCACGGSLYWCRQARCPSAW